MNKQHPPVVVVDEVDKVVGAAPLKEVWREGYYHRIVRIMVEDDRGRVLLQKRSANMDLYPNCWDHSAAGHVDEGETYEQAAARELQEELGIELAASQLAEVAHYQTTGEFKGRILRRFNKLYRVNVPVEQHFRVEKYEVAEVGWFTITEAKKLAAQHPDQATEGLAFVLGEYYLSL